ncbi:MULTISPECIES: hypothetical protein [unclassified Wolbachia]|nr:MULTISPECIES: hypothetical protein [unclassified Wolbachia]QIT35759.1 hypothetical protein WBP_0946 [Wolbachia endosymbiont of Brugia pahangi]
MRKRNYKCDLNEQIDQSYEFQWDARVVIGVIVGVDNVIELL